MVLGTVNSEATWWAPNRTTVHERSVRRRCSDTETGSSKFGFEPGLNSETMAKRVDCHRRPDGATLLRRCRVPGAWRLGLGGAGGCFTWNNTGRPIGTSELQRDWSEWINLWWGPVAAKSTSVCIRYLIDRGRKDANC